MQGTSGQCLAALALVVITACATGSQEETGDGQGGASGGSGGDVAAAAGPGGSTAVVGGSGGGGGECIPEPEVCNGVDDDCDVAVDEDFNLNVPCDGPDADPCAEGTMTCFGCTDNGGDSVEIFCNFEDDDCDGQTDEDTTCIGCCDAGDGDSCKDDDGTCTPFGPTCFDAGGSIAEICNNGIDDDCDNAIDEVGPELCNGTDDNCDSVVDEGCNCVPEIICNGVDDDCDALIDEISSCTNCCDGGDGDSCMDDSANCTPFGIQCVDAGGTIPEICNNGIDDDCDSAIDEIVPEACNGFDDNCNSVIDEGCSCVPEIICNGIDDDCDTLTDEDQSCTNCCDSFSDSDLCPDDDGLCTPFGVNCTDTNGSIAEICSNGIDDDCDGIVDTDC